MKLKMMLAAGVASLALLGGAACSDANPAGQPAATAGNGSAATATVTRSQPTSLPAGQMTTAELVQYAEPAIVRIQTNSGVGSGFVVDPDGYIITNAHVVTGSTGRLASTITVTTSDGAQYPARVVGADTRADIALLKIDASGLKALEFANLADVQVGQDVVAMGFALDLQGGEGGSFSVTRGIISQKNRVINEGTNAAIFGSVQTDAAINHGNSGGPLLDMTGKVVGVNTAIAPDPTTGEQAPGIGFAVGSDIVKAIYEQLKAQGRVNRGYLGIQGFEALRPAVARQLGIPENEGGVVIQTVVPGGPVAQAGLQAKDVIVKVGSVEVNNEADLAVALIKNQAGQKVTVEFYRDGKKLSADVTLGTPPTN
ncbi:trypsin-like peptidase domain-containing protein [Tepidiforma sp.]|jgi:serine protease Do|uniref:S1C family serine protease n=1 Tax=Tepidiforma sp. TaxID=2682230 RepID=UPI00262B1BD5|nr:trypsin-like peptidase domain-containing protein [Tepidiforma sp.]MCX7617937.1 trypsin-like peptidase domain-containing protein [Tepidiforma sp.]